MHRAETEEFAGTRGGRLWRRLVGRFAAGPVTRPAQEEGWPLIERRAQHRGAGPRYRWRRPAGQRLRRLVRSALTCEPRLGVCRRCYGRNLATARAGRDRRGGRHHRGPVDRRARHAADDAYVPHRWRGRVPTSPPVCRAWRSCSRHACPRARPRSATSMAWPRSSRSRMVRAGQGHQPRALRCAHEAVQEARATVVDGDVVGRQVAAW